MKHDRHDLDEEAVNELVTRILQWSTKAGICVHYFEEMAWRLVISGVLEQADGNGPKAADLLAEMAKRKVELLRDPRLKTEVAVRDGERTH